MQDIKILTGRSVIYTALTPEMLNGPEGDTLLKTELENTVLPIHQMNMADCDFLEKYYLGYHPNIVNRDKITRSEINNKTVLNYAKSFTRDIVAYFLGKPIQFIHREDSKRDPLKKLNDALDAEGKQAIDCKIATNCSIMGVGYRGCFASKTEKKGTHLRMESLHPKETFVVESPDKEVGTLYCGTFYTTVPHPVTNEVKTIYTIYTPAYKYKFEAEGTPMGTYGVTAPSFGGLKQIEKVRYSFGGNLPIIQYRNNDRMTGDWESEISIMDALDQIPSDTLNDIEQFVNSILVAQGFEITEEVKEQLDTDKILNITDVPPGVNVVVKYIAEQLDGASIESIRDWLESTLRVIVGVPDRKARSGGGADTGDAVFLRDGWQDIDLVASSKEQFFVEADREALDVILYILKTFSEVDKSLELKDIDIKFARTKQSNMQAKAQTYSTLVGAQHPLAPSDALEFADLTNNVSDVIIRAEDYAKERQEKAMQMQMQNDTTGDDTQSNPDSGKNQVKSKKGDDEEETE